MHPQRRVAFDLAQDVEPAHARQCQIEQHELRAGGGGELLFPAQESHRLEASICARDQGDKMHGLIRSLDFDPDEAFAAKCQLRRKP